MAFILLGLGGFLLFLFSDWADVKGLGPLRMGSAAGAAALIVLAAAGILFTPGRFELPLALRVSGAVMCALFLFLLALSLFVEIPTGTYSGGQARRVVSTGTYLLVRHPAVIWLLFLHLSAVAASGSRLLLTAAPFWFVMNVVVAAVEDRVFFPRLFGDSYREYRRSVPFLIPTAASFSRFFSAVGSSLRGKS